MERNRFRFSVFLVSAWVVCLFLAIVSIGFGQHADPPSSGIPYRRVFVPSNDLGSIGLDDFSPIDVKHLEELMQKYSKLRPSEAASTNVLDIEGRMRLQSTYYIAKLVGADLLSERSRLTLAGSTYPSERVTLRPWSLAVHTPSIVDPRSELQSSPNLIFDDQGSPQIAIMTSELTGSGGAMARSGEFHYPFGWSARAESTSTPNLLKFSFEIPKCANSCLVLALPPQAIVQDCLTVVRRVDEWAEIDLRLKGWDDFAKENLREQSPSRSPESLWLIELGGSQFVSFSIALGVGVRLQDDTSGSQVHRYRQLIRSQNLEHSIEGQEIRTTCEAEVSISPEQALMRMSLAPGSRLRRLSVNQQDVDWKVDKGWIQWSIAPALQGSSPLGPASVFAEFISPLPTGEIEKLDTPEVSFDRGYVMSGTTVVHTSSPWRLTNVECETSRIAEPTVDSKTTGVNRIEFSWYANPPRFTVGLERTPITRHCEILTHLTNDEQNTLAFVRAKLFFAEQDSSQTKIFIASGWNVQSIQSLDPSDAVTVQVEMDSITTASELRLSWERVQKSRVGEIEIRLVRNSEKTLGQLRKVENKSIVQLPSWKRSETLVVEDSGLFELQLRDSLIDNLVASESMPSWQKSFLPRMSKYHVFRFESPVSDHSINFDKVESDLGETTIQLPDLVWLAKPNRHQAKLKIEIDRISGTALRAKHEIQLTLGSNRNESVSIELPSDNILWRLKEGKKWIPLSPVDSRSALSNSGSAVWQFDLRQMGTECTLLAVVDSEINADHEAVFAVPKLLNANLVMREARSISTEVSIRCSDESSLWNIDEAGNKFLNFTAATTSPVLTAKVSDKSPLKKWFIMRNEHHVAVDAFGCQNASILFRSSSPPHNTFAIEIDYGWEPVSVSLLGSSISQDVPFRMDGRLLVISPEQRENGGEIEMHINLTGPRLLKKFSLGTMGENFLFKWPDFLADTNCLSHRRYLWLPINMQVAELDNPSQVHQQDSWPIWRWSRQVVASLFGYSSFQAPTQSIVSSQSTCDLVPQWAASDWRIVLGTVNVEQAHSSVGTSNVRTGFRVVRVDSNRSYLALFFALVALITPRLLMFRFHAAALCAAFLIVCAHTAPIGIARFAYTGLTGMSIGFIAFMIYRLLSRPVNADGSVSQRNSARWSSWNDRVGENESESNRSNGMRVATVRTAAANLGSLGLYLAIGWGVASEYSPLAPRAMGQEKTDGGRTTVYQIVIPMDDAGSMAGTTAYIPIEMLDTLNGKSDRIRFAERGTHPFSAKYTLRVGTRGRVFNSADQITMAYDFLVGDDLAPVRFPINGSQLQLPRFSVDGIEMNLGNRLRSRGFEWIWTPDKPGRHSIQMISQPVLKSNDTDRNRESFIQQLDVAILPIANATIEVETDAQNSIEIVSRGRVTNPVAGRFVAMLGAVDRLQFSVMAPIIKSGGAFPTPTTNIAESGNAPIMHTEIFIQNDILQAKTIVDFPKGTAIAREIEIEADLQWLPVGTHWGDAEWRESRSGSTLSRRRYVLQWKNDSSNSNPIAISNRDLQISVIWVPQSATQSLNVLFAECLDRRTRRGTLRYSRAPGSNWSIEGISTWNSVIDPKNRLDWPELKANPYATALRIPANGGSGLLKPKSNSDRQQARVTTKWVVDQNRETLTSRIELLGGSFTSDTLVVELPSDFRVTDLYNRNGPIRFLQKKSNGKLHLQVLAERKSLEVSDLWIQAKRQESVVSESNREVEWLELPWLDVPSSINSDQTMEVFASEFFALRMESVPALIFGKGPNVPVLNLAKSFSDIHSKPLAASRYHLIHRKEALAGKLMLKLNSNSSPREISVIGQFLTSVSSRPFFVLEVPTTLRDRWQSELRINVIPCPDPDKAWIQVHLPEPTSLDRENQVSTLVRFMPRSDEPLSDSELTTRVYALDRDLIPTYSIDPVVVATANNVSDSNPNPDKSTSGLSVTKCILRIRDVSLSATPTAQYVFLESQYWIEETDNSLSALGKLEWQLGDDVEILSIDVNGKPMDYEQDGRRIRCTLNPAGLYSDVNLFTKHKTNVRTQGKLTIDAPQWMGSLANPDILLIDDPRVEVLLARLPLVATVQRQAVRAIAESCLDIAENSDVRWPNSDRIDRGSDLDQWKRYWHQKAYRYLKDWSEAGDTGDHVAFGLAVQRWHLLETSVRASENTKSRGQRIDMFDKIGNIGSDLTELGLVQTTTSSSRVNNWYSIFGCLFILLSLTWLAPSMGAVLFDRPWWYLLALGLFAWLVFGTILPVLVLGLIGLIVATDSYWIVTSRLRRTGIRGLR